MSSSLQFPKTYEEARRRFRESTAAVQSRWPQARLESHALSAHPDLTIDWICAPATHSPRHRFIFTTGEHGIEGYVGSAMLSLFMEEFLPHLDPRETGLLLVHIINPWGMAHRRRVNARNVDLNRNFLEAQEFVEVHEVNPAYGRMQSVLNPEGEVRSYGAASRRWLLSLIPAVLSVGVGGLKEATLLGQYRFPKGIYYGGERLEEETRTMMALYRRAWAGYGQVIHLDMHTGYGPRGQMTIVNASQETHPPSFFQSLFSYPHIVATEPSEFYTIHGDMVEWIYSTLSQEAPETDLYATTFEFGTLGDSVPALVRSLQALVFENQAFWYGASEDAQRKIDAAFTALFYPQDPAWQAQAIQQARQGFRGALSAFGLL